MASILNSARPSRGELALFSLAGSAIFFGLWQILASSGLVSKFVLPSPAEVAIAAFTMMVDPFAGNTIQGHVIASLARWAMGFGLAAAIGVPLGLAMGYWRLLDAMMTPIFEAYRYIAPLAWVPFAALWFGTGLGGPVMVIFTGALSTVSRSAESVKPNGANGACNRLKSPAC